MSESTTDSIPAALSQWFATQLGVDHVDIEDFGGIPVGHSAETLTMTIVHDGADGSHRDEVVLRVRPQPPSLLEPVDLRKQYDILRALAPTPVHSPEVLWYEGTGEVLGREFFVMRRSPGTVFEGFLPQELIDDGPRVRRMSEQLVDELVAIHTVDTSTLDFLPSGRNFGAEQLAHWSGEMRRVQRGPLPALEGLLEVLEANVPPATEAITLVHGDAKPGNFAFVGDRLSATFDWELAALGDPMFDVGYAQVTWMLPTMFTGLPASLTIDELVTRWEERTGLRAHDLAWHRAFQGYKLGVIMLVGSMLFDEGHSDDPRLGAMGTYMYIYTSPAYEALGLEPATDQGAVLARPERLALLQQEN